MFKETQEGIEIMVRVSPRASSDAVCGEHNGALKIRLCAPPFEGRANEALVKFLSRLLDVPKSAVIIISGAAGRTKRVKVSGVRLADATGKLGVNHLPET